MINILAKSLHRACIFHLVMKGRVYKRVYKIFLVRIYSQTGIQTNCPHEDRENELTDIVVAEPYVQRIYF